MSVDGMNYETIKALAKQRKCRVDDLIVLSRANDPFYCGTPADQINARWFAELWQAFGYSRGIHIRRAHYQIISQSDPILMPNGMPYENMESCWAFLNAASKAARYLELVDVKAFVDRRNPAPISFVPELNGAPSITVANNIFVDAPMLPEFPELPNYVLHHYQGCQRYHIEVWAEKSTMNDVLVPLCKQHGAVLQTGLGELSITAVNALIGRVRDYGKPTRILYVSDFDPAGQSMPVAVARKIERAHHKLGEFAMDMDIRLQPVCLTEQQVREYQLPRTPIKDTERRGASFEARYGSGAVELDALEALYPGTLRAVLIGVIKRYFDSNLEWRVLERRHALNERLTMTRDDIIESHRDEIDQLEHEYAEIREAFNARLASHTRRLEALWGKIEDELQEAAPDPDDYPIPQADEATEVDALYDSGRDYLDQLAAYKAFQGKSGV